MIGYSKDYGLCTGKSSTNSVGNFGVSAEKLACRTFVNKAVEPICDRHKYEKNLVNLSRHTAGRPGL